MKNKKILLILIPILFLIILITLFLVQKFLSKSYRNELSNNKKSLLIESSHENYAWGWRYSGTGIFSDGTIYTWDNSNYDGNAPEDTNMALSNWILTYGTKQDLKVTTKDLSKLESNLSTLKDALTYSEDNIPMYDAGLTYICIWSGDTSFILSASGDYFGKNMTKESKTIRSIAKPYFDKLEK